MHLSDLMCRMRGMGYGYYERRKVDMISDPAWEILAREHRELDGMDLARFTFELDDAVGEIFDLVSMVFWRLACACLRPISARDECDAGIRFDCKQGN